MDYIDERSAQEEIANIVTVLGEFQDPKLPTNDVDPRLLPQYTAPHQGPGGYLKLLASHLKADGRVVVIDMIDGHKDDPEMQIDVESVVGWMETADFNGPSRSICSRISFSWYSNGNRPGTRS